MLERDVVPSVTELRIRECVTKIGDGYRLDARFLERLSDFARIAL